MYGHIEVDGTARTMKFWFKASENAEAELRHTIEVHNAGTADGTLADPYGHQCKCPPGTFIVGRPQHLNPPERAYGFAFTPLSDKAPGGPMAQHGREGIGVHGGGSDLADPFADEQGWEWTFGCPRIQNKDNREIFVPFVEYVLDHGGEVEFTLVYS